MSNPNQRTNPPGVGSNDVDSYNKGPKRSHDGGSQAVEVGVDESPGSDEPDEDD